MAQDNATFLRRSLQLDGIASGLCGALLLAAASPISTLVGLPGPGIARMVAAVAAPVLVFAMLDVVGLRRLREA